MPPSYGNHRFYVLDGITLHAAILLSVASAVWSAAAKEGGKEMTSSQDQVRQWGAVAEAYVHSSFHSAGPDLRRLVAEAGFSGQESVLDLGCGAGHTSLACAPHA